MCQLAGNMLGIRAKGQAYSGLRHLRRARCVRCLVSHSIYTSHQSLWRRREGLVSVVLLRGRGFDLHVLAVFARP
jgi:hypothetical protein